MSEKVYVVVSEEWYGGDCIKAFNTATAKEDAEHYINECVQKTDGKVDFILKEVDLVLL